MRSFCLYLSAVLALLVFAVPAVFAHTITVDGSSVDWELSPPGVSNLGHIARDDNGMGEYVWRDTQGDERSDFSFPDPNIDLLEFRITSDPDGLYFMAEFSEIPFEGGDGAVQLQITLDRDQMPGAGELWLGGFSDTMVSPEAAWEYLVMTRFGSGNPEPSVYDAAWMNAPSGAISALSSVNNCLEIFVPWEAVGGLPESRIRFTVATFHSSEMDETWDIPGLSDALDVVTNYGDPGSLANTWHEVEDGVVDCFFDVWFQLDPDMEPSPPLLITEVLYDPAGLEPDHEWFEVHNLTDAPLELTDYRIGDEEQADGSEGMMTFPPGSVIAPGQTIVIANNALEFTPLWSLEPDYELTDSDPMTADLMPTPLWADGFVALSNSGDQLLLLDSCWTILDVVTWEDGNYPGVTASPGAGPGESITRINPDDTNNCSIDFEVSAEPSPSCFMGPVAVMFAHPNPASCGQPIEFDAGSSYHTNPSQSIVAYWWDFSYDGSTFVPEAEGMMVSHPYPLFGSYTAALRITDNSMPPQMDIDTVVLDVSLGNLPPMADAGGPYAINAGMILGLDGSASTDPDQDCGDTIVEYSWDLNNDSVFDDASGVMPVVDWALLNALGLSGTGNPISLRVEDSFGLYSINATTLDIEDTSGVIPEILPETFALQQNAPNPFNPSTTIIFEVPRTAVADLRIFDISGRLVLAVFTGRTFEAGRHDVVWNGRDHQGRQVPTGAYFYCFQAGSYVETKRMMLLK